MDLPDLSKAGYLDTRRSILKIAAEKSKGVGVPVPRMDIPELTDCPDCLGCEDSDGTIECDRCDGTGEILPPLRLQKIKHDLFDFYNLQRVSTLQNVVIYPCFNKKPAYFTFTGGEGWIMPSFTRKWMDDAERKGKNIDR